MTIKELKNHLLFPFSDFRTNDASFLLLELFWTQVVREALGEEFSQKIEPLMMCERDDEGEPYYDPVMLDFWVPEMRRGGRIMLIENPDNLPLCDLAKGDERFECYCNFIFYWQNRGITGPDDEIEQIVFRSDLTDEAIKAVQHVMSAFLIEQISTDEVDQLWEDNKVKRNLPTQAEWEDYYDRKYPDDD